MKTDVGGSHRHVIAAYQSNHKANIIIIMELFGSRRQCLIVLSYRHPFAVNSILPSPLMIFFTRC